MTKRKKNEPPREMDLTPTPQLLAVLDHVAIETWQCVAEIIDNSLDNLADHKIAKGKVHIVYSNGVLEISDNGSGMKFDELENALKAGYSSKKKTTDLGLFGIGFNIACARLGRKTTVLTKVKSESKCYLRERWRILHYDGTMDKKSFRGPHTDWTNHSCHRRMSIIIGLSEPSMYTGGELVFKNNNLQYKIEKGAAVVFDSRLVHEVLPVTSGERYVLQAFLFDDTGLKVLK